MGIIREVVQKRKLFEEKLGTHQALQKKSLLRTDTT